MLDKSVQDYKEYLMGGSGRFDCSIKYKTADLAKIPGSKVNDITQGG